MVNNSNYSENYKNMKSKSLTYKLCTLVALFATMCLSFSCTQEDYIYSPQSSEVSFESIPNKPYDLNGNNITVSISRSVLDEPLTVNVSLQSGSIYTLKDGNITFASGEHTKQLTLTYDDTSLEAFVEYPFVLTFNSGSVSPTGISTFKGIGQVPFSLDALEYEDYGLVYCENSMFGAGNDFDGRTFVLQAAKYVKEYYRIKNVFGGGVDMDFIMHNDGSMEITAPNQTTPPSEVNNYDLYKFPTDMDYQGEKITMWFDTDADYLRVVDQAEEGYPMVEGTYFSNYALWSTPTAGLLTSDHFRGDEGDDGWWRLYFTVKTVF